jgi:hypothetical protein
MASQSVTQSESIAAFIPELEHLIVEAMDEWKVPGLAVAVVQNGEVALVRAYGLRDVEAAPRHRRFTNRGKAASDESFFCPRENARIVGQPVL